MLRITTSNADGTVWIKLEGKLVGPWVEACRTECARLAGDGGFRIDLSAVAFVDSAGEELLRGLARADVIGPSSSFVRELLWPRASAGPGPEETVRRLLPGLLDLARRLLPREAEAVDAVQSAFRAVSGDAGPRSATSPDLDAALRSQVIDACIARARAGTSAPGAAVEGLLPRFDRAGNHAEPVAPWPPPGDIAPETLLSITRRSFDGLPDVHRLVAVLHDVEGLSPGEIARRLELPLADVRRHLHQARQALIGLVRPGLRSACGQVLEAAKTA